ncbi:MAG TPA: AMIN domain-containing protein, partial [Geobacteraceae bacterium]
IVALLRAAKPAPVTASPTAKAPQPLPPAPLPTPTRVAAPPAPPSRQNGQPAAIGKIVVTATGLEVNADAPLADFRAFILKEPHRLVVDIPRAKGSAGTVTLPANPWGIVTARTGVYPDKVRLVFDTSKAPVPPYTVAQTATGLKITFDAPARGQDKPAPKARRASRD